MDRRSLCPSRNGSWLAAFLALNTVALAGDGAGAKEAGGLPPPAAVQVDFARDIRPIFARSCTSCHGPVKQKGGLRLDLKARALAGGDSGAVFEPGHSAESLLIEYVAGLDPDLVMPPEGERLTAAQVGLLRAWIDQGAPWPEESSNPASASEAKTSTDHWAFRAPVRPAVPAVRRQAWVRNPIDAFILAPLEARGVEPAPEADRPTLIRRLSLDLTGLPPSPAEVVAFVQDRRPDAYKLLVDRLLASPHYGERWGRHWLDLARYADSDGYEKDSPRPHAWRYRNWVIDALNRDLPFDQFTAQQLAGDLLPGADLGTKAATGFHRNTLTNREGGVDPEEFRVAAVVDRVNTTGTVWLGLTIGCAQCHTHKYDPIIHKEYYGLFAFFNTEKEEDLLAATPEESRAYERAKADFEARKAKLTEALRLYDTTRRPALQEKWEESLRKACGTAPAAPPKEPIPARIAAILAAPREDRCPVEESELADYHRSIDPEWTKLDKALKGHVKKGPDDARARVQALVEAPNPPKTHVHIRGDFLRKGEEVRPGTLAVLPPLKVSAGNKAATRLDLARWLTDPGNPLTARVTVNRFWHRLFGRGLVATADDFGTRGEPPSHPELLDWLATEFVARGWSQKALIKLIVESATYRQASRARPELLDRDPNNVRLARQNRLRLEAEVLRDVTLATGGLLAPVVGGPSVHPPQPAGISELTYGGGARWVVSNGPDRYRRGLYTWFQRTSPYPMLMTFDAPDSNVCAVKRERSNTPLQALTMLNDPIFFECAQALGRRIVEGSCGVDGRIRNAFLISLAREPSADETAVLRGLVADFQAQCGARPDEARKLLGAWKPEEVGAAEAAAWVAVARTLLNLDEFVTRE